MEKIKIDVAGNIARATERPKKVTSGTVGLPVEFTFDSAWNGLKKTAVFRVCNVSKIVDELGASTVVPWEVLTKPGDWLHIGVFGTNEDGTLTIPTVWARVAPVLPGASPNGECGADPQFPDWTRMLIGQSAYELAKALGFRGTEADWIASLKGDKGEKGDKGDKGAKGDKGDVGVFTLDGEKTNIDMGGYKVTGLGAPTNDGDAVPWGKVAGFGLGTASKYASDLNTCLVNGWYYVRQNTKNIPAGFDYGSVFVTDRNIEGAPEQVVQVLYAFFNSAIDGTRSANCMLIRSTTDGGNTWQERWVNPPLEVGVEYVTIEERQGRAVVKKLDTDGVLKYKLLGTSSWKTYAQEVGAAPAGYGLGGEPVYLDDANEADIGGWYSFTDTTANKPEHMNWGTIFPRRRHGTEIIQDAVDIYGTRALRMLKGSAWTEWAYENPPMVPGVDYLTTERYYGEAVHKMLDTSGNVLWRTDSEEAWRSTSGVSHVKASELKSYLDSRTFDVDETIVLSGVCDTRVILRHDKNSMTQTGTITTTIGSEDKEVPLYSSVRKIKSLTLDGANNATVHGFDLASGRSFISSDYEDTFGRWYYVEPSYDIDTLVFKNMTFTDHVDLDDRDGKTVIKNVVFENVMFVSNGNMTDTHSFIRPYSDYNSIKNVTVKNCIFKGDGGVMNGIGAVCNAETGVNITIENCTFDNFQWDAIQLLGSGTYNGRICISNNTIFDIHDIAIQLFNLSGRFICCGNLLVNVGTGSMRPAEESLVNVAGQDHSSSTIVNNTYSKDGTGISIINGRHDAS